MVQLQGSSGPRGLKALLEESAQSRRLALACLSAMLLLFVLAGPLNGRTISIHVPAVALPSMPSMGHGGGGGRGELPPRAAFCRWSPYLLSKEDQRYAIELARLELPTMVSGVRLLLTAQMALGALRGDIPGDFVETGTAEGGASILMMMILDKLDPDVTRKHWAADSFQGLPEPVEQDRNGPMDDGEAGRYAFPQDEFMANVRDDTWGLGGTLDRRLQVLPGWFNETLPGAGIHQIAFLRLDGDLYVSTKDALEALYDKVAPGGLIYIDDYGGFTGCMRAIDEFRLARGITTPLMHQSLPEGELQDPSFRWEAAWFIKPPCPVPADADP